MSLTIVKSFAVVVLIIVIIVLGIDVEHKNNTITLFQNNIRNANAQINQNNSLIDSLKTEERYIYMRDLIEQLQVIEEIKSK